jgi:hypothetical protein
MTMDEYAELREAKKRIRLLDAGQIHYRHLDPYRRRGSTRLSFTNLGDVDQVGHLDLSGPFLSPARPHFRTPTTRFAVSSTSFMTRVAGVAERLARVASGWGISLVLQRRIVWKVDGSGEVSAPVEHVALPVESGNQSP